MPGGVHLPVATGAEGRSPCRILSLDGGGAKGVYSLGVLTELEALLGPLHRHFHLIFGTSTGAIIGALLALGHPVAAVHDLYRTQVPPVLGRRTRRARSVALSALATKVFRDTRFDEFLTGVGIVATRWELERPVIFKTSVAQSYGRSATFVPGFGCTIAEAIMASCAAYPFFERVQVSIDACPTLMIDGGYCANNPTLFAIADAVFGFGYAPDHVCVVSIGVGVYPPRTRWTAWLSQQLVTGRLLQKTLSVNSGAMDHLRTILFQDVPTVRINEKFEGRDRAVDLLETRPDKLDRLFQLGRESFAKYEGELRELLEVGREPNDAHNGIHESPQ